MSDGAPAQTSGGDAGQGQAQGDGGGFDAAQAFGELRGSQEQMQQLLGQMGDRLNALPQPEAGQEPDAGQGEPEVDLSFLDDPGADPQQLAATINQLVEQRVQSGVQQALEQHVDPLREGLTEERHHREAADIVAEFPELGSQEMQDKLFNPQTGAVVQLAQQAGQPDLAKQPWFWRQSYLALKGMEAAQAEQEPGADASGAAHLEGGGGANPGGGQVDLADLIVQGGRPRQGGVFG